MKTIFGNSNSRFDPNGHIEIEMLRNDAFYLFDPKDGELKILHEGETERASLVIYSNERGGVMTGSVIHVSEIRDVKSHPVFSVVKTLPSRTYVEVKLGGVKKHQAKPISLEDSVKKYGEKLRPLLQKGLFEITP